MSSRSIGESRPFGLAVDDFVRFEFNPDVEGSAFSRFMGLACPFGFAGDELVRFRFVPDVEGTASCGSGMFVKTDGR